MSFNRFGKAQLVTGRVQDVEVPLSPHCVSRRKRGVQIGAGSSTVHFVNVSNKEDDTAPGVRCSRGRRIEGVRNEQVHVKSVGAVTKAHRREPLAWPTKRALK